MAATPPDDVVHTVRLRVLGPVDIDYLRADGSSVQHVDLTNRRATLLLVCLALERGPHNAADLLQLLVDHNATWDEKSARNLLQRAASDARAALGPAKTLLKYNKGLLQYELRRDSNFLTIDVDEAQALARSAASVEDSGTRVRIYRDAIAWHRGPIAQGIDEVWLANKRGQQTQLLFSLIQNVFPDLGDTAVEALADTVLTGDALPAAPSPTQAHESRAIDELVYARDCRRAYELEGSAVLGHPARILGIVTRRHKTKHRMFLDIVDRTGDTVQVIVGDHAPGWSAAIDAQTGDRIFARGSLTIMRPRHSHNSILSIDATDFTERKSATGTGPNRDITGSVPPHRGTYIARLTNHFRQRLLRGGFSEVATKLISTDWPDDGVDVLRVVFDGFGSPIFLSPSPIPQLIDGLIEAPFTRMFTVGYCITPTYRDPHVSTEAAVIALVSLDMDLRYMLDEVHKMAVDLYRSGPTAPLRSVRRTVSVKGLNWPPSSLATAVTEPEMQIFDAASEHDAAGGAAPATVLGRLCWPHDDPEPQLRDCVLAEGYGRLAGKKAILSTTVIHIERLLTLLLEERDIRRIPMLAGDSQELSAGSH